MSVAIVRTNWSGTSGGPGLTQLALREAGGAPWTLTHAQNAVNHVRTWWTAFTSYLPNEVTLTVSPVVDVYNEVDGQLTASVIAGTAPTNVVGASAGSYSMAAGIKVNWNTGIIRNGRRVKGATFIVPTVSTAWNSNGQAESTVRTALNTANATLISNLLTSGLELVVYSRPLDATQPKGPRVGAYAAVIAGETNEKTAVLRGRRD